jgi:hypothetical protein
VTPPDIEPIRLLGNHIHHRVTGKEMRQHPYHRASIHIRSFHFTDPDGIMLEFACWTEQFTDGENAAVPKTSADRRPRHVVAH